MTGKDLVARFRVAVQEPQPNITNFTLGEKDPVDRERSHLNNSVVTVKEIKDLWQMFQVKTGYGDPNVWVEWVKYTIQSLNHSKSYACASGQPAAQGDPFPLREISQEWNT